MDAEEQRHVAADALPVEDLERRRRVVLPVLPLALVREDERAGRPLEPVRERASVLKCSVLRLRTRIA